MVWKIEGHKDDRVVMATAPDERSAFGVMDCFGELGFFPSAYPAAACDSCERVVHVDDLRMVHGARVCGGCVPALRSA